MFENDSLMAWRGLETFKKWENVQDEGEGGVLLSITSF